MKIILSKIAVVILLFTLIPNLSACNGNKGEITSDTVENGSKATMKTGRESGDVLFSTEYDIEEYCQGCFIVSKNDGLLYGVLDMSGNEILPVRYDDVYFLNADEVKEGKQENVYIKTKYEKEYNVFDNNGKSISNEDLNFFEDEYLDHSDVNAPFFYSYEKDKNGVEYNIYNEHLDEVGHLEHIGAYDKGRIAWLNNELCLLGDAVISDSVGVQSKISLYNINGDILKEWDGLTFYTEKTGDNITITIDVRKELTKPEYIKYVMDKNGNILDETQTTDVPITSAGSEAPYFFNNGVRLDKTNGTWKLIGSDGKPMYDERYYKCYRYIEDSNECYLLSDEDNNVCVIDSFGNIIADYGVIDFSEADNYKEHLTILNGLKTNNKLFVEEKCLYVAVKNEGKNDIYYFTGTN